MSEHPDLTTLIEAAYAAVVAEVHRRLDAAGFADIRPAHGKVFDTIGQDGSRITDMAERAQVTKGSMVELVDHLQRGGYLERVPDPADGRAKIVRLTPRGWDAVRVAVGAIADAEQRWTAHVGERNMRALRRALQALPPLLDPGGR
ncbi:MarR family winged helix-turn-helix transcriptional regulator [Blastococcus deserti]|uniref:MarR family winged helix-turn-helix transcriptional regulator n=1 Tax=Blastococcus deserti TaxID=2259033 RepID=A0ABW4XFI3_9ACTN